MGAPIHDVRILRKASFDSFPWRCQGRAHGQCARPSGDAGGEDRRPRGQLHSIAQEAHREDVARCLQYVRIQTDKSEVEVRLSTETTPDLVKEIAPDTLIVAVVGSRPVVPPIAGSDSERVLGFHATIGHIHELGRNVMIVGAGTIGAELALELAETPDKNVTLIGSSDTVAEQGNMLYRIALRQAFERDADRLIV